MLDKREMKVSIGDLFDLWVEGNKLEQRGDSLGQKFAFILAENMEVAYPHVKALQTSARADKGYVEYEKQKEELLKKFAFEKNGKLLRRDGQYLIKDPNGLESAMVELQENSKAFQAREKLLQHKTSVTFYLVNSRHLPSVINFKLMRAIRYFIVQEDDRIECPKCGEVFELKGKAKVSPE